MNFAENRKSILPWLCALGLIVSCAASRPAENPGGDSGCDDCGERGELELEIFDERGFAEINPKSLELLDSMAILGSFPALEISAICPDGHKLCHSFSPDAVDFDLAHGEDSLIALRFPKMTHEQMLEGLRIPEEDSLWIRGRLEEFQKEIFADGKSLGDTSPWKDRAEFPTKFSAFDRRIPLPLKNRLVEISKRYNLRYVSVPLKIEVEILPKLGKSGGFRWQSLWTLWDVRRGELLLLSYQEFFAKTTGRVAPERGWSKPFTERLGKILFTDPKEIENH